MIDDTREVAAFVDREPRSRLVIQTLRSKSNLNDRSTVILSIVLRDVGHLIDRLDGDASTLCRSVGVITSRAHSTALYTMDFRDTFRARSIEPTLSTFMRMDFADSAVITDRSDYVLVEYPARSRAVIISRADSKHTHGVNSKDKGSVSSALTGDVAYFVDVRCTGFLKDRTDNLAAGFLDVRDAFIAHSRVVMYCVSVQDAADAGVLHSVVGVVQTFRADLKEKARLNDAYRTRTRIR